MQISTNLTFKGIKNAKGLKDKPGVNAQRNTSFKGNPIIKAFSTLERDPVLALFTIDALGMILPRTIIDIQRNKEELGHLNWDAGRETIMREVFSSGLMFFGPGVVFNWLGNKFIDSKLNPYGINTKAFTNYSTLNAIEAATKKVLSGKTGTIAVNELRQEVAKELLKGIKGATNGVELSKFSHLIDDVVKEVGSSMGRANIDKTIAEFIKKHPDANPATIRKALLGAKDKGVAAFIKKFLPEVCRPKHLKEAEVILTVNGSKPVSSSISNVIRDIFFATDDVIMKAANGSEKIAVSEMQSSLDKIITSTKKLKMPKALLSFAIVFGLLFSFPKFSAWLTKKLNGGKEEFPGLTGLKKEKAEDKINFSSKDQIVAQPATQKTNSRPAVQTTQRSYPSYDPNNPFDVFERRMTV